VDAHEGVAEAEFEFLSQERIARETKHINRQSKPGYAGAGSVSTRATIVRAVAVLLADGRGTGW